MGNRGNITKISLLILLGISLFAIGSISDAFAVTTTDLYTCDKATGTKISKISETDGSVISFNTISNISGGTPAFTNPPTRCLGLATDPTDAQMYAIIRDNNFLRYLVKIDPTTGSATMVGFFKLKEIGFTDFIANNIAFDSSGQLFVTESIGGNFSPNEYYKMNKVGASGVVLVDDDGVDGGTPECTFISAGDFNLIALNHDDGSQYHILGGGTGEQHKIGKIDITQADCIIGSESNLPLGTSFSMDMTYSTTAGKFFVRHDDAVGGGVPQTLDTVTTGGVLVTIATDIPPVSQRGLAFALNIAPPLDPFGNPTHLYLLDGDGTDEKGGNSLVLSDGGTGLNATGWNFLKADKATLLSSIDEFEYGIEMVFSMDTINSSPFFERILDWHNFVGSTTNIDPDFGLYITSSPSSGEFTFFDNTATVGYGIECGSPIVNNQSLHILVQRNATSNLVELYADGAFCTSFTDSEPEFTFDQTSQLITFLKDNGTEDSDGFVDCIAIYGGVMNATSAISTTNASNCFSAPPALIPAFGNPIHLYNLNEDFTDELGGNNILPTFRFSFNSEGWLNPFGWNIERDTSYGNLTNSIDQFDYGIEMVLEQEITTGRTHRILDWHNNLGSVANSDPDFGFYSDNGKFSFRGFGTDCGTISDSNTGSPLFEFTPNLSTHILIQRNAVTELVELYQDGSLCTSFTDSDPEFTFDQPNQIIKFFRDKEPFSAPFEGQTGLVNCIAIYNGTMSSAEAITTTTNPLQCFTGTEPTELPDTFGNPSHLYLLNGDATDQEGGTNLVLETKTFPSGTFVANTTGLNSTGWNFDVNDKATLKNSIDKFTYGIELVFSMDVEKCSQPLATSGFCKVLDWHNGARVGGNEGSLVNDESDWGLYIIVETRGDDNGKLEFFDSEGGDQVFYGDKAVDTACGSILSGVPVHIFLQRNGIRSAEFIELYQDGKFCTSFNDVEPEFTFADDFSSIGTDDVHILLMQDEVGGANPPSLPESTSGFLDCFAIYNGTMSSSKAQITSGNFGSCPFTISNQIPVVTRTGDAQVFIATGGTYVEEGATCVDTEDGSIAVTIGGDIVDTSTAPAVFTVTYDCTDSFLQPATTVTRTIAIFDPVTGGTGGAIGGLIGGLGGAPDQPLTQEEQVAIDEAFNQAVQDAIDAIGVSEGNIVETIIQTFFEFIVVDKVHEEIQLNSFLDRERLGIRWSTGENIIIASATPSSSPFMITFEQFPVVKQGSGAFVSTSFVGYILQVPRNECTIEVTTDCVQKVRYEIPVTVNAIINGTNVSDTGTITVDLTEDPIDPILLIILATFAVPIIGVIVQRARGRSSVEAIRRGVGG